MKADLFEIKISKVSLEEYDSKKKVKTWKHLSQQNPNMAYTLSIKRETEFIIFKIREDSVNTRLVFNLKVTIEVNEKEKNFVSPNALRMTVKAPILAMRYNIFDIVSNEIILKKAQFTICEKAEFSETIALVKKYGISLKDLQNTVHLETKTEGKEKSNDQGILSSQYSGPATCFNPYTTALEVYKEQEEWQDEKTINQSKRRKTMQNKINSYKTASLNGIDGPNVYTAAHSPNSLNVDIERTISPYNNRSNDGTQVFSQNPNNSTHYYFPQSKLSNDFNLDNGFQSPNTNQAFIFDSQKVKNNNSPEINLFKKAAEDQSTFTPSQGLYNVSSEYHKNYITDPNMKEVLAYDPIYFEEKYEPLHKQLAKYDNPGYQRVLQGASITNAYKNLAQTSNIEPHTYENSVTYDCSLKPLRESKVMDKKDIQDLLTTVLKTVLDEKANINNKIDSTSNNGLKRFEEIETQLSVPENSFSSKSKTFIEKNDSIYLAKNYKSQDLNLISSLNNNSLSKIYDEHFLTLEDSTKYGILKNLNFVEGIKLYQMCNEESKIALIEMAGAGLPFKDETMSTTVKAGIPNQANANLLANEKKTIELLSKLERITKRLETNVNKVIKNNQKVIKNENENSSKKKKYPPDYSKQLELWTPVSEKIEFKIVGDRMLRKGILPNTASNVSIYAEHSQSDCKSLSLSQNSDESLVAKENSNLI